MKYALISVSDKRGLIEFARGLRELGFSLLSTGGTAAALAKEHIPVTEIAEFTGSPEILGGRVKTLHPRVHGGILAQSTPEHLSELERYDIPPIDIVVCNLYPFEETIAKSGVSEDEAVENIDIGGVTLIRSASKNFARVLLLIDPGDYPDALERLRKIDCDQAYRRRMALKGFQRTSKYDQAIYDYFTSHQV